MWRTDDLAKKENCFLCVPNPPHYQAIRKAVSARSFINVDGTPWPTVSLKGKVRGQIQLRPLVIDGNNLLPPEEIESWREKMNKQAQDLSDLDVDVLDALFGLWAQQERASDEVLMVSVDEVLIMRGLKKKIGGTGCRGGFRSNQRDQIMDVIWRLQNLNLNVHIKMPGSKQKHFYGRPFTVTDCTGKKLFHGFKSEKRILFRPGEVITYFLEDDWRQTALLSVKILAFDPYRQQWGKRLSRYLSWQWRIRVPKCTHLEAYRVSTLLEAVGIALDIRNPSRTRERLEQALDTLRDECVIVGWQYDRWEQSMGTRRGWFKEWLQWTVTIEPPDEIKRQYENISRYEKAKPKSIVKAEHLGQEIQTLRKKLGLSQQQVVEDLGISTSYLSLLENGKRGKERNSSQLKKVKRWLERYRHG